MTRFALILRNLRYFRGVNLALIAGMAVATAVLTGAMMVGNSVQASLADLARARLGKITDALISQRFFNESLAVRLQSDPQIAGQFTTAPAIILQGGASNEAETIRAGNVQIIAMDQPFANVPAGHCILNSPTAQALGVNKTGTTILLSLPTKPDEPREAALSRRSREDTLANLRSQLDDIHTASDMISLFNPNGGQRVPQNAWVNLRELQDRIELRGRINTVVAADRSGGDLMQSAGLLNQKLKSIVQLEDYGLSLEKSDSSGDAILTSDSGELDPPLVSVAESVAKSANIPLTKVTVNLVNAVQLTSSENAGQKPVHYLVAAGLTSLDGHALGDDQIAINQWMADQLHANVGDRIQFTFYKRLPTGDLQITSTESTGFKNGLVVSRVLPMSGIGADPTLTPKFRGVTDAKTVSQWNPPQGITINKTLVTKADEDYWNKYKAAPKLFVSFTTAQKLWGGGIEEVNSLRIPSAKADEFRQQMHEKLDPAAMGLSFQAILAQQLAASAGSSNFGELFIGFSFFIIVAAVLLVAMLFRLNVEQRARQLGLLSALGFAPWTVRRMSLAEGMILAAIGGLLGIPAAIGYTAFVMYGLRTWWIGAVGTSALYLHVAPGTLFGGYFISLAVAFFAIVWAVWRVGRTRAATLLAGGWGRAQTSRRSGVFVRVTSIILALLAISLFAYAFFDTENQQYTFMTGGTLLLCACLFWLGGWLRPHKRRLREPAAISTISNLGIRNASRHTSRSVLAIGLIAFAAFTLITVAAFRQGAPSDTGKTTSGAGGYRLMITAGIPLLGDLNTRQGRELLGITDPSDAIWKDVHFVSMRKWAGQDISCLNLTRPTTPTILSVPSEMTQAPNAKDKHRFAFSPGSPDNPWLLLDQAQSDGSIPVIADENTANYILNLQVGNTLTVRDSGSIDRQLKLVATLSNSIFQSEMLMSEANFRRLFPTQQGYNVVLAECPAAEMTPLQQAINTQLGEYAVDAQPTANRLQEYLNIENTYLSTFQALGALGLMLGTIGLAVVLVRTVIERRGELALLASLGYRQADRIKLVLSENLFLLVIGLAVGAICAGLGILPTLIHSGHGVNLGALAGTLVLVLLIGAISSSLAVFISGVHVSAADLRRE